MKKKTSGILLLSTFAAMVLAGCGTKPATSTEGGSSVAPGTSVDGGTSNAGTSNTAGTSTTSQAGTSTTSQAGTSTTSQAGGTSTPVASSSSQPAASSSTQQTWQQLGLCGQYNGGMASLIINTDNTTSWGTSADKFPATMTALPNGVYHIQSAASVAEEDRVDVYTDGTMAHVVHDEGSLDNYVMDKGATGAAAMAFAETEDETSFFGAVETSNGHWKYFQNNNGAYTFNIGLTLEAGTNINGLGGIFSVGSGATAKSYRVTTPAAGEGGFAKIELFNLTTAVYHGDNGDLVIGKTEGGELAFAKLEGNELFGATLDGNALTVKGTEYTVGVDANGNPSKIYQATVYTLELIAGRYTAGEGTVAETLFHELTGNSGTYQVEVGADGNLWASFRSDTVGGVLHVTETIQVHGGTSTLGWDTNIAIYKVTPTTDYSSTTTGGASGCVLNEDDGYNPCQSDLAIQKGVTYVIKIGAYADRNKSYDGTGSSCAGQVEEIEWTFTPNTVDTYTSADGDVVIIEKAGTNIVSVDINGAVTTSYSIDGAGTTLVTKTSAIDPEDPSNTSTIITTTTIVLDSANHTCTMTSDSESQRLFNPLTTTNPTYNGVTGIDGAMWTVFVAPADGVLSATASDWQNVDDVLDCYIYDPATTDPTTWTSSNYFKHSDHTTSMEPEYFDAFEVQAGKMYVFKQYKYGAFKTYGVDCNDNSLKGVSLSITISFSALTNKVYTCAGQADLKLSFSDEGLYSAKLGTTALAGYALSDDQTTLTIKGTSTVNDGANPTKTSTDTVYTLDNATGTYVKTTPTNTENIFVDLTETSTEMSGITGNDGNIWARFAPTQDGFITLREKISCYPTSSTYITIFEQDTTPAATDYTSTTGTNAKKYAYSTYNTKAVAIENFPVLAGHTYIIRAGYGSSYSYTGTAYGGKGVTEKVTFNFATPDVETYHGAEGDLKITMLNDEPYKAVVGDDETTAITYQGGEMNAAGTELKVERVWLDNADPADPKKATTKKTFTLDGVNHTYTVVTDEVKESVCKKLTAADTEYEDLLGDDGNLWATFTAPSDGMMKVSEEISYASYYGYITIYELSSTFTLADCTGTSSTATGVVGYKSCSSSDHAVTISVVAGKTYAIKVGAYSSYTPLSEITTPNTYASSNEKLGFEFTPYVATEYTDGEGNTLTVNTLGSTYKSTTYNGESFNATRSTDGLTYTKKGTPTLNEEGDPVISWADETYTLDAEEHTFTKTEEQHNLEIVQGTIDAVPGSVDATTLVNGSAVVKFVAPADGSVTFTTAFATAVDCAFGIYTDRMCTVLAQGATMYDGGSGSTESQTINVTAGQTYYVKAAAFAVRSYALTNLTAGSSFVGKNVTISVA
ncbi:MAG: hypothetical protein MJ228_01425 [Bacilli bacterium]|nr:hypothetical protein [Bacilli bacterium]